MTFVAGMEEDMVVNPTMSEKSTVTSSYLQPEHRRASDEETSKPKQSDEQSSRKLLASRALTAWLVAAVCTVPRLTNCDRIGAGIIWFPCVRASPRRGGRLSGPR